MGTEEAQGPPALPKRLESLDALRGFVMFWIIGGDTLMQQLAAATRCQPFLWLAEQMKHVAWNGFHFEDAIFPTFLFAAGAALPFSSLRKLSEGKTTRAKELVLGARRALILIVLGMIVNGLLQGHWGEWMHNVRFGSVLGRIGSAWYLALVIALFCDRRGRALWLAGVLLGYWAAMMLIPVQGHGAGELVRGANLCDFIDQHCMPGRLFKGNHDPEGLFSTIPAIGTALLGLFAGDFMRHSTRSDATKTYFLGAAGFLAIGIGLLWDQTFPINKSLWTSSFVLMAGGLSLLLFGFFHWLIAARRWTALAFPFTVIGMNAIAIYMATEGMINFQHTAEYLFSGAIHGVIASTAHAWRDVAMSVGVIAIEWSCLWFLWRQKIFLRV